MTATAARPAKGTEFTTSNGCAMRVTSVRKSQWTGEPTVFFTPAVSVGQGEALFMTLDEWHADRAAEVVAHPGAAGLTAAEIEEEAGRLAEAAGLTLDEARDTFLEGREEVLADDAITAADPAAPTYREWTGVTITATGRVAGWLRPAADGHGFAAMGTDEFDLGVFDTLELAVEAISDDIDVPPAQLAAPTL